MKIGRETMEYRPEEVTPVSLLEMAARKHPNQEFLICEEIRRTFKEVDDRVNSLGS